MTTVGDWDEEKDQELRRLREVSEEKVRADWQPGPETLQAIWGEGKTQEAEEIGDIERFTDPPEMERDLRNKFRQEMDSLSALERGAWGEKAVVEEARDRSHRILSEHTETPTTPGYDCVSWDGRTLHIWEAKNYSWNEQVDSPGIAQSASAWEAERSLPNVENFLSELPLDDPERRTIARAVDENRVEWHLRLGPDTDSAFVPRPPGHGDYDVRRYSYGYMLRIRRS